MAPIMASDAPCDCAYKTRTGTTIPIPIYATQTARETERSVRLRSIETRDFPLNGRGSISTLASILAEAPVSVNWTFGQETDLFLIAIRRLLGKMGCSELTCNLEKQKWVIEDREMRGRHIFTATRVLRSPWASGPYASFLNSSAHQTCVMGNRLTNGCLSLFLATSDL